MRANIPGARRSIGLMSLSKLPPPFSAPRTYWRLLWVLVDARTGAHVLRTYWLLWVLVWTYWRARGSSSTHMFSEQQIQRAPMPAATRPITLPTLSGRFSLFASAPPLLLTCQFSRPPGEGRLRLWRYPRPEALHLRNVSVAQLPRRRCPLAGRVLWRRNPPDCLPSLEPPQNHSRHCTPDAEGKIELPQPDY